MSPDQEIISIRPFWRIVPASHPGNPDPFDIEIIPGAGWGTGAHETTQLCLQAITLMAPKKASPGWRMLDFGSGSGILSIGAAKLGGTVDAVEIDEKGFASGIENARINGIEARIRPTHSLEGLSGNYDVVVANILRPVLLEFAEKLAQRLAATGTLILSGLVATDLPEVSTRYSYFLNGRQPVIYKRGDWRALIWQSY